MVLENPKQSLKSPGNILEFQPQESLGTLCTSSSTLFKHLRNHRAGQSNFKWNFYGVGEQKFVQMVLVTWPRWPPFPYMVNTFKNLLLRNQKANDLETWYAASGAQVLLNLFKCWPWPILRQDKIWSLMLLYREKGKTIDFSETVVVYDI